MNITRRSVLLDALRARELIVQRDSVGGMMLSPREGCEKSFEKYSEECRILRQLIQALEDSCVRAAIAEFLEENEEKEPAGWQKDVMAGKKKIGLFAEEKDGHQKTDGADHPEGE